MVSSHANRLWYVCQDTEISASKNSAITPRQWRWIEFCFTWCSKHRRINCIMNLRSLSIEHQTFSQSSHPVIWIQLFNCTFRHWKIQLHLFLDMASPLLLVIYRIHSLQFSLELYFNRWNSNWNRKQFAESWIISINLDIFAKNSKLLASALSS